MRWLRRLGAVWCGCLAIGAALAVGMLQQRVGSACDPLYSVNGAGLIFFWLPLIFVGTFAITGITYSLVARRKSGLAYAALPLTLLITVLIVWAMVTYLTHDAYVQPDMCPSGNPTWWP
jgi:hypothetical protein